MELGGHGPSTPAARELVESECPNQLAIATNRPPKMEESTVWGRDADIARAIFG